MPEWPPRQRLGRTPPSRDQFNRKQDSLAMKLDAKTFGLNTRIISRATSPRLAARTVPH